MSKMFLQIIIGILAGAIVGRIMVPHFENTRKNNLFIASICVAVYVITANVAGAFI